MYKTLFLTLFVCCDAFAKHKICRDMMERIVEIQQSIRVIEDSIGDDVEKIFVTQTATLADNALNYLEDVCKFRMP